MLNNAIRTWIYVRDVDVTYSGVVQDRKQIFKEEGLTENSHFIASTGIEGRNQYQSCLSFMDAYSVGMKPQQIQYLTVPDCMCSTSEYGVTFERGTFIIMVITGMCLFQMTHNSLLCFRYLHVNFANAKRSESKVFLHRSHVIPFWTVMVKNWKNCETICLWFCVTFAAIKIPIVDSRHSHSFIVAIFCNITF